MPTKDVVKTSTLSRRWLKVQDLKHLDLYISLETSKDLLYFKSFVDWVDRRYSDKILKRFSVHLEDLPWNKDMQAKIDCLIHFAVVRRVKQMSLGLDFCYFDYEHWSWDLDKYFYKLPRFLCNHYGLESLHIANCAFPNPCTGFKWSSLKELSITQVNLGRNNILLKIFIGSPSLELLELDGCWGLMQIDTRNSLRLRELVIVSYQSVLRLEIIATNLLILRLRGDWQYQELKLTDASSIVEAELNFLMRVEKGNDAYYIPPPQSFCDNFFGELQHISTLHIGDWCNEVVSSMMKAEVNSPELTKCKHLITDSMADRQISLIGITTLLERSAHLEKLELRMLQRCIDDEDIFRSFEKYLKHVKTFVLRRLDAATGRTIMKRVFHLGNMEDSKWLSKLQANGTERCLSSLPNRF
ncbi:hypothetical protein CRG98_024282 [Punica granatum]|uniref:At1g61320/AtMIF1 LRR domain-containing protein n=1 Tax=Punica granatum TaxID=22663 RepID=A0A2I0JI35_PUNGR|nr:hypothetical protein CRG98_024282 [Punica granatum]